MATTSGLVRVDTHKLMFVVYGLCQAGRGPLVFEPHPDAPGVVVVGFAGRHGGHGQVAIADQERFRATLGWLAGHRNGEPHLRAVWAALRAQQRLGLPWAHERAVELLWGLRDQRESRARQVPVVRDLVELLCAATWSLDASVNPVGPNNGGARRQTDRAAYGGSFSGCLVAVDADTRQVTVDVDLARQLDTGPYDLRDPALFRLRIPGHRNPRGHRPSRAARAQMRHGIGDYTRMRQQAALNRDGQVQAIAVEDFLARWTSLDVDAIHTGRRMGAFVDALEEDLAAGVMGDVTLPAPIERQRRPGRCQLRLSISLARRPKTADQRAGNRSRRRRGDDRRPGVSASPTGKPSITGPPRP